MLRKFKITIDGKEYLVEMEEIGGTKSSGPTAPAAVEPVKEEVATPAASESVKKEVVTTASGKALTAPMPGTILRILVNVGDTVVENQPILILEAMKMENEIVADRNGTIQAIQVNSGDVVNSGDALLVIG